MSNRSQTPSYENRPPPPLPPPPDRTNSNTKIYNFTQQTIIAEQFPQLLEMSKEGLDDLAYNEIVFESFFEGLDRIKSTRDFQDEMRRGNEMLAVKTLAREQEMIQLRQSIKDQEAALKEKYAKFSDKLKIQQEALHRFSPSLLLTKLKSEIQLSDELSEQMAKAFLEGGTEIEQFLKHFREVRKVYHLRNAKVERVSRQPGIFMSHKFPSFQSLWSPPL